MLLTNLFALTNLHFIFAIVFFGVEIDSKPSLKYCPLFAKKDV